MASRKPSSGQQSSSESISAKTERDGPYSLESRAAVRRKDTEQWAKLTPDKELEKTCLHRNLVFVIENLPPEDVAPQMCTRQLLTQRENEEFQSMKKSRFSGIDKSEHLIQCLLRRQAGALQSFCEILDDIAPAKHISDKLKEDYRSMCRVSYLRQDSFCPENRDRYSKLSLSDPDIRIKDITQHCAQCKVLERQNEKLDQQCRRINAQLKDVHIEYRQLYERHLKMKAYTEVAKEQLKQRNRTLKEMVLKLQSEVIQRDTRDKTVEETFTRLEQIFTESKKPPIGSWNVESEDKYVPLSMLFCQSPKSRMQYPQFPKVASQSDTLRSAGSLVLGHVPQNVKPLPIEEHPDHDYEDIDKDTIPSPDTPVAFVPSPQTPPRNDNLVPPPLPPQRSRSTSPRPLHVNIDQQQISPDVHGETIVKGSAQSPPNLRMILSHLPPHLPDQCPKKGIKPQPPNMGQRIHVSPDSELQRKLSQQRQKIEQPSE